MEQTMLFFFLHLMFINLTYIHWLQGHFWQQIESHLPPDHAEDQSGTPVNGHCFSHEIYRFGYPLISIGYFHPSAPMGEVCAQKMKKKLQHSYQKKSKDNFVDNYVEWRSLNWSNVIEKLSWSNLSQTLKTAVYR